MANKVGIFIKKQVTFYGEKKSWQDFL